MGKRLERELLRSVPIFFGLKGVEMRRFVEACTLTNLGAQKTLCSVGEPSRKLWILLEGCLDIVTPDGVSVARLEPVQTVGEMGVITRRPRTATVRALSPVRLLEIAFHRLDALLDADEALRTGLYRNFIRVLAERLADANDKAARYKRLYEEALAGERMVDGPAAPAGEAPPSPALDTGEDGASEAQHTPSAEHVASFFKLLHRLPTPQDMEEGGRVVHQLREEGYSDVDIEYAVKWTARHVKAARRFSMVQVAIQEALEDKWSI